MALFMSPRNTLPEAKYFAFLFLTVFTVNINAQSPHKMTSQAIVRDAAGDLVTNQQVGMQISILQTTVGGTAVYVETQTPTTNASGLVSIAIGTGAVVTGVYATIDWSADSYFIKTETDPTGGTSYSITGTSQILSVPYALYANSAATVITAANGTPAGGTEGQVLQMVEAVPTWVDASFSLFYKDTDGDGYGDINNTILASAMPNGYVANNTDCDDGNPTVNPGQSEIYGDEIDNNCDGAIDEIEIGQIIDNDGVVFYLTDNATTDLDGDGDYDKGLICAFSDCPFSVNWGCQGIDLTSVPNVTDPAGNPVGLGAEIGNGRSNTINILIDCPTASAALAAHSLGPDWFLPSIKELHEIYLNRATLESVPGFIPFYNRPYWSSTEYDSYVAWKQDFSNGDKTNYIKNSVEPVRAVRAF